jgi:acyl-CoA thioesterase-1
MTTRDLHRTSRFSCPYLHWAAPVLLAIAAACSDDDAESAGALPGEGASRVAERSGEALRPAREIPDDAPVVAVLGDSIAAGLHLGADDAFPAALQRLLVEQGRPFRLVNAGVSGDTSAGGLRRLEWVLRSKPAVLIVELGANDGLRGSPLDELEKNLREIVRGGRASGARVVLVGMQMPPNLGPPYSRGFEELFGRVAEQEGAVFVPQFLRGVGGEARLNLEDGLHPTVEGHEILAANLAPALGAVLDELARE